LFGPRFKPGTSQTTVKTIIASANLSGVNFHLLILYLLNYNSVAHIIERYYLLKKKCICVIEGLSSYRAVNSLHLGYKTPSFNAV